MDADRSQDAEQATASLSASMDLIADPHYELSLYVVGLSPRSTLAVERIKAICEQYLAGRYHLSVIDLYQRPELARQAQIIAAPTLVKELPAPQRLLVGDMQDEAKVLRALNVQRS